MAFKLDPAIAAGLAALAGTDPPLPLPAGDVEGRRARLDIMFGMLDADQPAVPDVEIKDHHTKTEDGHDLLLRWFTKKDANPPGSAVFYSHGGGMIALHLKHYESMLKRYVSRTGVPFLAVEYRLAPEVQAPTPVTDAYTGLAWLHAHASELGIDPSRIAIMGDSAGGGITASLAHYAKQRNGPPIAKQILVYPMLDDRSTVHAEHKDLAPFLTWTVDDNITGWGALLGAERVGAEDVNVVEAAGRMKPAEARGLPPAYIDVGELDLFRDEDLEYARNLGKGGVSVELHLIPAVPHAYEAFAPEAECSRWIMSKREEVVKRI